MKTIIFLSRKIKELDQKGKQILEYLLFILNPKKVLIIKEELDRIILNRVEDISKNSLVIFVNPNDDQLNISTDVACFVNNKLKIYKKENILRMNKNNNRIKDIAFNSFNFIKKNKFVFIVNFILSTLLTFTFAVPLTYQTADIYEEELVLLKESGFSSAFVRSNNTWSYSRGYNVEVKRENMMENQRNDLFDFYGENSICRVISNDLTFKTHQNIRNVLDDNYANKSYASNLEGYVEFGDETLNEFLKMDSRLNDNSRAHFPGDFTEVAISSNKANYILDNGYYDNDNNLIKLESINELIGLELGIFKISAVYEVDQPDAKEFTSKNPKFVQNYYKYNKDNYNFYIKDKYLSNFGYVKKGFIII